MTNRIARRTALGLAGAVLAAPTVLRAQTGTIRIIVPFAPGGSTDLVARLVSPGLTQRLGQTVIVENRSGAAGSIGTDLVAKSRPDGQTWLLTFDSHSVMPVLLPSLPFDLTRDLDPVMLIGGAAYVLATRADKPYQTLADVVAAAKAQPDQISYGSTGNGTLGHLTMVLLQSRAGIRMPHLPYRGGGLALNDTVAGHIEMMTGSAALVGPHIAAGTLRAIAQFGPVRLPALGQVQTAEEAGYPGLTAEAWWGVFGPHGTPAVTVARMNQALRETLSEDGPRQQMLEQQQARLVLSDPAGLRTFLDGEIAKWSQVVRDNHIRPD